MTAKPLAAFIAAFSLCLLPLAANASDIGQEVADQISTANYQHYLVDLLYTRADDNRDGVHGDDHAPARANIVATLQSFGLQVEVQSFTSNYGTHYNVVATQTGLIYPDAYSVIGAHYDSVNNPGADDNASGVAGVMEIARVLSTYQTDYTIKYMAFDMEEYGLYGSWDYIQNHFVDDIRGMISIDMISFAGSAYGCDIGSYFAASLPFQQAVQSAMIEYGVQIVPTVAFGYRASDHYPFEYAGVPACLLIEGNYQTNPCYHHSCDTVDNPGYINYAYGSHIVRSIAGFLADHAQALPKDCDANGILDRQEILDDPALDCDHDGHLDACQPEGAGDCNANGILDRCDVYDTTSLDCNHNLIPDECEPDCNSNGIADPCDIHSGLSADCDRNAVPDDCQDTSADCNANGLWDPCDLSGVVFEENFENDLPAGWSTSGLWHLTSQCPRPNTCDPTHWAYYGLDQYCNFDAGATAGSLTSAPISLPVAGALTLTYCSAYDGQGGSPPDGIDAAYLTANDVLIDDVAADGPQLLWSTRTVDLSPFAGQSVVLAWRFNTRFDWQNTTLGWQIDSIQISAAELHDCNRNLVPDSCDIASGTSLDRDADGLPDDCEDCNNNGVSDTCEVPGGCAVADCAGAPTCGQSPDCNNNGIPDLCGADDNCPPANLHWVQPPTPISTTSISMEAFATDSFPLHYYFGASGTGSHPRNWGPSPAYTDAGLQVNRNYTYSVKAKDLSPLANETAAISVSVATMIETPAALTLTDMTTTSIKVTAPGTFTRLNAAQSGLYFEVTTLGGVPVGGAPAHTRVRTQSITVTGLTQGATYRFRVKARNYYGQNETPWYPAAGCIRQLLLTRTQEPPPPFIGE